MTPLIMPPPPDISAVYGHPRPFFCPEEGKRACFPRYNPVCWDIPRNEGKMPSGISTLRAEDGQTEFDEEEERR
jgi:hypothetical protein